VRAQRGLDQYLAPNTQPPPLAEQESI
jgi:hypothetical protein